MYKSFSPDMVAGRQSYAASTKISPLYLWGGEWWYWRWQKYNDASVWEATEEALK